MRENAYPVIDGDGHIMENASEIMPYMGEKYVGSDGQPAWARMYSLFPSLDGWTRLSNMSSSGLRDYPDCDMWVSFLDDCGIDRTVVYPTAGLGFGLIQDPAYSVNIAHAYNTWLHEYYMKHTPGSWASR